MLIKEMYAYIIVEVDNEGIPAVRHPDGTFVPMIGTDKEMMDEMAAVAQIVSNKSGSMLKLARFTYAETVQVLNPEAEDGSTIPPAEIYH